MFGNRSTRVCANRKPARRGNFVSDEKVQAVTYTGSDGDEWSSEEMWKFVYVQKICGSTLFGNCKDCKTSALKSIKRLHTWLLTIQPAFLKPVYLVKIQGPDNSLGDVRSTPNKKPGDVQSDESTMGMPAYDVKDSLLLNGSFCFSTDLRGKAGDQAIPQCAFGQWER